MCSNSTKDSSFRTVFKLFILLKHYEDFKNLNNQEYRTILTYHLDFQSGRLVWFDWNDISLRIIMSPRNMTLFTGPCPTNIVAMKRNRNYSLFHTIAPEMRQTRQCARGSWGSFPHLLDKCMAVMPGHDERGNGRPIKWKWHQYGGVKGGDK